MKKLWFELRMRKISLTKSMIICALFLVVGVSTISLMASFADANLSGATDTSVTADTVFINDLNSDYDYYMGLNYTTITNDSIPTKQNLYSNSNLVRVFITYSGTDLNDTSLVGHVSGTETQKEFRYYKYYPKDGSGRITIELPDNLFTSRPAGKGFNGWVTTDTNVTFRMERSTYTRYAIIPVSGNDYVVEFHASWIDANYLTGDYNQIANFDNYGMKQVPAKNVESLVHTGDVNHFYLKSNLEYYTYESVNRRGIFTGYEYQDLGNGVSTYVWRNNYTCNNPTCQFYQRITDEYVDGTRPIYFIQPKSWDPDHLQEVYVNLYDANNVDHVDYNVPVYQTQVVGQAPDLPNGYNALGYFLRYDNLPNGDDRSWYYDQNGVNCADGGSCGGAVYRMIQQNAPDNMRVIDTEPDSPVEQWQVQQNSVGGYTTAGSLYYLVTRDMQILTLSSDQTLDGNYMNAKPYTLTADANGGTPSVHLNTTDNIISLAGDMVIENIPIQNTHGADDDENVYTAYGYTHRVLSANRHNLKIGRNVMPNTAGNFSLYGITGTSQASNTNSKFKVIVESGVYDYLMSNGFNPNNNNPQRIDNTMQGTFIYGSDYDRAKNDHDNLIITFCAYAANYGGLRATNSTTPSSTMIVKSGSYGKGADGSTYDTDYSHGIYAGSRGSNSNYDYSLRSLIVEGGDINVINGGPLVDSSIYGRNVISIYMKGGLVRSIFGGAGQAETGGNRIVSVTGGEVTNNVFGGSNSYSGNNNDGYLNGDTLVYVGGHAVIGTSSTVLFGNGNPPTSPSPGDVFGAGNGRNGNNYKGVVNNTTVIIDGGTINGSVYGGGNYGAAGYRTNNNVTTNISLLGGTITGSVYGGGNNSGGGRNATFAVGNTPPITVNITLDGAVVEEAIFGGSNTSGTLRGNVNINLISGNDANTNVYGGGRGQNTTVQGNTNVTASASPDTALKLNEVYGGSAFGHVNTLTSAKSNVTINGGTITSVYGGSEGSATIAPDSAGEIVVEINGGDLDDVYGGNNKNGIPQQLILVNLNGGTIDNAYGGGNASAVANSKIYLKGATVNEAVYGGSNSSGDNPTGEVHVESGSANQVFGGNNSGGSVGETVVYYLGADIADGVYGCGKGAGTSCAVTNVYINNENTQMNAAYGGGYAASVTNTAKLLMLRGEIENVFGGSNTAGTVQATHVYISGGSPENVYGGNNDGGRTVNALVDVGGSNLEYVYGGGRNAETTNTIVNHYAGYTKNLYGGGLNGGVSGETNVTILGGIVTKTFGGSNSNGLVAKTNVVVDANADSKVYDDEEEYNGEVQQETVNTDVTITFTLQQEYLIHHDPNCWFTNSNGHQNPDFCNYNVGARMTITITNDMDVPLEEYRVYFEGNNAYPAPTDSGQNWFRHKIKYDEVEGKYYFDEEWTDEAQGWYGTRNHVIPAHTSVQLPDNNGLWIMSDDENMQSMSSNLKTYTNAGHVEISYEYPTYTPTTLIVRDVYGGNNVGGNALETNVDATNGYASYIYGGSKGTGALAGNTNVTITGGDIINVYGGGDESTTTGNAFVSITDGSVTTLYGGGNGSPATVQGNTNVIVDGGVANNNVFAGGNNAATEGNTTISIIDGVVHGSLFGSGDNAPTGTQNNDNSVSTVNVLAGTIDGNVYGGANHSVVYGTTDVNIGADTVTDSSLAGYTYTKAISIGGTIFGGGESKTEGDDDYDWTVISVTQGIDIDIDGTDYDITIGGSVFGSGNASSNAGISNITIRDLGTEADVKTMESIQRATNVKIINSAIQLLGAVDSTNKYSNLFTMNRIDNFYLLDNSTLYLKNGANVLKNFNSGTFNNNDDFVKETITIVDGTITSRNVNNKLYMAPNKNLNVLTNEDVLPSNAGIVNGMCFLGIYVANEDGQTMNTGIYNTSYTNNQAVSTETAELMKYSGTYVYGKHKDNHNIEVDGYWSYYLSEDEGHVNIDYVDVTPKNAQYYMWAIGVQVKQYEIDLIASRYSTLGVKSLPLLGLENPNTQFIVNQFQYDNLNSGVTIVDRNTVKKVADTSAIANSTFGLGMSTSDTGWMSNEYTNFYSRRPSFDGSTEYMTESTNATPTLSFYLYNSKNIELNEDEVRRSLGYSSVIMTAIAPDPDDPLSSTISTIEVKVNIYLQKYVDDGYSSVIAPGKKYSVFPYVNPYISSNGSVSIYHNLFLDLNGVDKNGEQWSVQKLYPNGAYRALASDYVYPVGTTITMIDLTDNQYYYYTVTNDNITAKIAEKATRGEVSYRLSDFIKMDSTSLNNHYSDSGGNARYYNSSQNSAFEEFIFTVDFSNANVTSDVTSRLYLELRDPNHNDAAIITPIPAQGERMQFTLFTDSGTELITTGELSSDTLYVGDSITVDLNTEYSQAEAQDGQAIYDTSYDEYQLGAAISFFDSNGNKLDGSSLLGVVININGKDYYAQTNGTYRVNLAGKIANVNSIMKIDTAASNIVSGTYTMRIDTFGSYDGLYSGEFRNEPLYKTINILNNKFGLLVESSDVSITHDKNDSTDENGSKTIDFSITTQTGQDNPNLRVRLERRNYLDTTTYGDLTYEYESVDLADFVTDELTVADASRKLYYVADTLPQERQTITYSLTLKDGPLKTGTYRIVFGVYDGDNYIGSVYRYLIIREMK